MSSDKNQIEPAGKREVATPQGVERLETRTRFVPSVDIYETDKELVMLVDMPGVAEKNVELTIEKNVLTLTGRVDDDPCAKKSALFREYEVGTFERAFTLPDGLDRDGIAATTKDGVLTVRFPKLSPTTRKIAVSGG